LVEAAEKLFAENGFEVVSVRDITHAAGGNVAAVNYHFGSRDGLVAVVMTRYLTPLNEERLARLEAAEQKWAGQAVPVEEVVDAFVRPLITQVEKSELSESLYYRLVGRIFGAHSHAIPPVVEAQLGVSITRFTRALGKALPTVAAEDLMWRLHFVIGAMVYMLTHGEAMQRLAQGTAGAPSMAITMERFLCFAVAGLRGGGMSPPAELAVAMGSASEAHVSAEQAVAPLETAADEMADTGCETTIPSEPVPDGGYATTMPVEDADVYTAAEAVEDADDYTAAEPVEDVDDYAAAEAVEDVDDYAAAEPVVEVDDYTAAEVVDADDSTAAEPVEDADDSTAAEPVEDADDSTAAELAVDVDDYAAATPGGAQVSAGEPAVAPAVADVPSPKSEKKRSKKAEQDSPQVMFEF